MSQVQPLPAVSPSNNMTGSGGPAGRSPTAQKVRDLYEKGTRAIRHLQLQYKLNDSYMQGQQWVYQHATRQEILKLPHNPRKVRVTIPRVGPESRRLMAKALKRPNIYQVTPTAPDEATIRAAAIAEGVVTSIALSHKWERVKEELAWAGWKGGTAALCLDWDASAGTQLSQDPVTDKPVGTGEIKETVLTIAEMCTEPGNRDIERGLWWIKAQALPAPDVRQMYKLPAMPESDASPAISPMQQRIQQGTTPMSMTLVLTYYERPSPTNPQGTVCVVVNDRIVDGPHPWPFPFTDRLNLAVLRETMQEGQWTGTTILSDAIPIQTALNASWTNTLEHLKAAGNARMWADEGSRDLVEELTDEVAEIAFYRDQKPPSWVAPPQMPAWWMDLPDRLNGAMDDVLGVHDISRGGDVANIQSGAGLAILAEQDDTPIGAYTQKLADVFGDFATMVLQTYEKKVQAPESRKAMIPNPGQVAETIKWSGGDLMGQTTCTVPYDAVAPLNEAARFARLQFYVQAGIISSAGQASAYMDVPGMNGDFIEAIDADVSKARRENYEIMNGEVCIPATFDDHTKHIYEHNIERKSARYDRADAKQKQIMDTHVQAHSTLAAEEMGAQMMKQQYAPGLAQAAQATEPPGSAQPPPSTTPQATAGAQMGGDTNGGGSGEKNGMPPLGIAPLGPGENTQRETFFLNRDLNAKQ